MDRICKGIFLVLWIGSAVSSAAGSYPVSNPLRNRTDGHINGASAECRWGMGYPQSCPSPQYPPGNSVCCRNNQDPYCCKPQARTICGVYHDGFTTRTGTFSYDPGPQWLTIWCPRDGDSNEATMCCFTKTFSYPYRRIHCCSPRRVWGIVGGVIGGVVLIGLIFFLVMRCKRRAAERAATLSTFSAPASPTIIEPAMPKSETDALGPAPGAMPPPSYDVTTGAAGSAYVPPYPTASAPGGDAPGFPSPAPPAYPGYPPPGVAGYQAGYQAGAIGSNPPYPPEQTKQPFSIKPRYNQ